VITTSTALMLRLFAEPEGAGMLMLSVPTGLRELADRVASEADVPGYDRVVRRKGRWVFRVEPEVWPFVEDLRNVRMEDLRKDRDPLTEVLSRIAASGWSMRPLLREEFGYLQAGIGLGNWCRGIPFIG